MADEDVSGVSAEAETPTGNDDIEEEMTPEIEPVEPTAEVEVLPDAEGDAEPPTADEDATEPGADEPAAPVGASSPAKRKKKRLPRALRPQKTRAKRVPSSERKPITRLPKPEHARGRRQERQGMVVSASADKTIVVRVDVAKVHPIYKKVVKRSTRFHAHDEENRAKVGDVVRIVETRPLSRLKRWRLQEIVEVAK